MRWPWSRKRNPLWDELAAQAEQAEAGPEGPDLGPLSHAERNRLLFGDEDSHEGT